ncbi:hypothetical protein EUX98_g7327 [Antrodiella citrinella]|uniref:JmjC domain-containing protein n=1 Tax=Antrodiella citrinella TaxID=2447956 RepID=A0A4S4MU61_9APHY|nr:hypothetical protein EUX98_g7327 [Antrodiella citrinella]
MNCTTRENICAEIRGALSKGKTVVLVGVPKPSTELSWCAKDLNEIFMGIGREAQDMHARSKEYEEELDNARQEPEECMKIDQEEEAIEEDEDEDEDEEVMMYHTKISGAKLAQGAKKSNNARKFCMTALDIPCAEGSVPSLFKNVAEDCTPELFRRIRFKDEDKEKLKVAKMEHEKWSTRLKSQSNWKASIEESIIPMARNIDRDDWTDMSGHRDWTIAGSAGVVTYAHSDAHGLGTAVSVPVGRKIWVLLDVKAVNDGKGEKTPERVLTQMDSHVAFAYIPRKEDQMERMKNRVNEAGYLVLDKDSMMFMPPGKAHWVLTPQPSIAIGDHYLCFDTMHLTERAIVVNERSKRAGTNASHDQVARAIIRMAISMAVYKCGKKVLRKPFLSMARMVLHVELYTSDFVNKESEEAMGELWNARLVIQTILDHNNIEASTCAVPEKAHTFRIEHMKGLQESESGKERRLKLENWMPIDWKTLEWDDPGLQTVTVPKWLKDKLVQSW